MNIANIVGILIVGVVIFLMVKKIFKSGNCCGSRSSHGRVRKIGERCSADKSDSKKQMPPTEETVLDPICGMYIDQESAITKKLDGITYYFCSKTCAGKFAAKN
jgi:YHS domain-containing protein